MSKILVETSARHLHVTDEHLKILFGEGATLTPVKELSQPKQYACAERVTIVGSKKELKNVSILGPTRSKTQVEISMTDARGIGIAAQIRESGDIVGSVGCKLVGPKGEVEISEGVIVAKRHIHITPEDAVKFGVKDKEIVKTRINSERRSLTFDDVVIRVSEKFSTAMHIDTDESNAICSSNPAYAEIVK